MTTGPPPTLTGVFALLQSASPRFDGQRRRVTGLWDWALRVRPSGTSQVRLFTLCGWQRSSPWRNTTNIAGNHCLGRYRPGQTPNSVGKLVIASTTIATGRNPFCDQAYTPKKTGRRTFGERTYSSPGISTISVISQ